MSKILVVVLFCASVLAVRDSAAAPRPGSSEPAYAASGQTVNGMLFLRGKDLWKLEPCAGGNLGNSAWLLGLHCPTQGFPSPFSVPEVLVVVRQSTDLKLAVSAAQDSLLDNYEFTAVAPGTYSFQIEHPISGMGDASVRLYLEGEFAGEAETNLMTLGGFK